MTFAHRHIQALQGVSAPILPGFDYNFADDSGTLDGDYTFTRASDGTQFNSSGTLITQTTNAARVDHYIYDGADWLNQGILLEGARTNFARQSENVDGSGAWSTSNETVNTLNTTVAPDGNSTADTVDDQTSSGNPLRLQQNAGTANDSNPTVASVMVAKTSGDSHYLQMTGELVGGAALAARIVFNSNTGVITDTSPAVTASGVIDVENFWIIWVTVTNNSTGNTSHVHSIRPAYNTDGSATGVGSVTGSKVIWGWMREANAAFPSSYIKVTTSDGVRAADIATITRAPTAAYTILLSARTGLGPGILWSWDDGTADERVYVERNSSDEIHLRGVTGGVEQFDINAGTVADDTDFITVFRIAANDIAISLDGGAVGTDTSAALPTVTTQRLGMDHANDNHWNSTIARQTEWLTGLDDGYLIARSQ